MYCIAAAPGHVTMQLATGPAAAQMDMKCTSYLLKIGHAKVLKDYNSLHLIQKTFKRWNYYVLFFAYLLTWKNLLRQSQNIILLFSIETSIAFCKVFCISFKSLFIISDVDECINKPCSSNVCVNNEGSFSCYCPYGLTLSDDNITCTGMFFYIFILFS